MNNPLISNQELNLKRKIPKNDTGKSKFHMYNSDAFWVTQWNLNILKRSSAWKKLYNQQQKLIFPKDKNGNWLTTDPLSGNGWVESNTWQATWSVSHDIGCEK